MHSRAHNLKKVHTAKYKKKKKKIPVTEYLTQNKQQLNSVAQQPMMPKVSEPISGYVTMGPEVHEQMFRSGGHGSQEFWGRIPQLSSPVLSSQARLFLIYRPTERMKG
ncbi:hypothetical protein TNCV_57571 [Trichonephila clavipes]|nr:hypothetical protein TNCV_57571 [Trichonephila clavipes]